MVRKQIIYLIVFYFPSLFSCTINIRCLSSPPPYQEDGTYEKPYSDIFNGFTSRNDSKKLEINLIRSDEVCSSPKTEREPLVFDGIDFR
jgi:hypothetical protein